MRGLDRLVCLVGSVGVDKCRSRRKGVFGVGAETGGISSGRWRSAGVNGYRLLVILRFMFGIWSNSYCFVMLFRRDVVKVQFIWIFRSKGVSEFGEAVLFQI